MNADGSASLSNSSAIRIDNARLAFGGQVVFDRLSLTLPGHQWTCLLGPSGVGKTALLRLILGLHKPADAVCGTVICADGAPLAERAAYMAQRDLLLPWLSVRDNVLLGQRLRGQRIDAAGRRRADALLDAVGLNGVADAKPDTLSGGMRQRAALARTLMEDRSTVLMDEPFSAVDAITRIRLQTLSARMLTGRTVVMVTHDPLEALRLGHRIHVMAGRPARLDSPIVPPGAPPRAVDDPKILALQGRLLGRLAEVTGQ